MLKNVTVSIGNSDNKLTQQDWCAFCNNVDYFVRMYAKQVHFYGHGLPDKPWQNATWIFDLNEVEWKEPKLKYELAQLANKYQQDSIFWLSGTGEFLC